MNEMLTIKPDIQTPWLDRHLETSKRNQRPYKYREYWYTKHPLTINPKWKKAFSGREEYR